MPYTPELHRYQHMPVPIPEINAGIADDFSTERKFVDGDGAVPRKSFSRLVGSALHVWKTLKDLLAKSVANANGVRERISSRSDMDVSKSWVGARMPTRRESWAGKQPGALARKPILDRKAAPLERPRDRRNNYG